MNASIKKSLSFSLLAALVAALPGPCLAGSGAGTTAAPFLKIGAGARTAGMANAYGAVSDDATAIFWNPAGIASTKGSEFNFGYISYFEDVKTGNVSYDMDTGLGKLGVGLIYVSVPDIERRGLTDSAGMVPNQGTFGAADMAFSLALARQNVFDSLPNLDFGAAVKIVRSTIDNKTATAFAADAGMIYRAHKKLRLGAAVQNAGTQMKFVEEGDPLPISFRLGCAYTPTDSFLLAAQVEQYFIDKKFYPALGLEYWLAKMLALRGGYKFGYDTENLGAKAGLSLGAGIKASSVGLDYAFMPYGELGDTHRASFWIKF